MTAFAYLGGLLLSIGAIALIDVRWRLAFRRSPGASALAVGTGTALLLLWDLTGIGLGVFFRGESPWATGIVLAPELPLEEPVFLLFLCYLSLVCVLGVERLLDHGASRRRGPHGSATTAAPSTGDVANTPGGRHP
jgi:lycopene cyclase domain-containing protein